MRWGILSPLEQTQGEKFAEPVRRADSLLCFLLADTHFRVVTHVISYAPRKIQVEAIKAKVKSRMCEAEKPWDRGGAGSLHLKGGCATLADLVYAEILLHLAAGLPGPCNQLALPEISFLGP